MNSRLANDKTLEELEEERMARFINTPANERQAVTFKKPTVTPVAEPAKPSPRKWEPKASPPAANISRVQNTPPSPKPAAQPAPSPRAQPQSQGVSLSGTMDLSTRVQHLNSLLEQMAIDEDEYAARAEPLQVAQSIIQACTSGDFASLQRLLQENPRMNVDLIVQNEATPFSVAIAALISGKGRSNILELLIKHGAQVNRRKAGVSPLLSICTRATFPDAVNCVRVLLENGADAKATTVVSGKGEPRSCISLAVECNASPEIIRLLLQHGAGANDLLAPHGPLLMAAIIEEQFDIALVLLEFGADPNCRQIASGACCLALAVNNKQVQLCEALIQNGADRDLPAIRDQKTTVRQLVAQLAQRDQVGYQRIERLF